MRKIQFYNVPPRVGTLIIIISLALAACVPSGMPATQTATVQVVASSTSNPVPVTGAGATATATPAAAPLPSPTPADNNISTATPVAPVATATATAQVKPLVFKTANYNKLGTILVDGQGLTVYANKDDSHKVSTCNGSCAATWPPVLVQGQAPTAGKGVKASLLGLITRSDGTQQVTYNGHPLYYFSGDLKSGSFKGQGIGKEWFVVVLAKPAKEKSSSSSGGGTDSGGSSGGNGGSGGGMGGGY